MAVRDDVREMVREQLQSRELLYQMTKRDLLLRYKQTVMGFGWALFMPLVNTAVFSVIFTRVAPIETNMPYPLFAFSGLVSWNFFASALKFAVTSLTSNTGLVTKIYFPREVFPTSAVLVSAVDFSVALLVVLLMLVYYGTGFHWAMVLLPVVIFIQLCFTLAMALLLAMANLFYRDVKYVFEVVLTVWMFLTAVLYPIELVGGRLLWLLGWNPMTAIVEAYRDVLIRGELPGADFGVAAAFSVAFLLLAWLVFHRSEFKFAENV